MKNAQKKHFFSIRFKLMAFVIALSALLIGLVWLISVPLLEPLYYKQIKTDLDRTVNATVDLINKYGEIEYIQNGRVYLNSDFIKEVDALGLPLQGKCFDISNSGNLHMAGHEGLQEHCLIHPKTELNFWNASSNFNWDSTTAIKLRFEVQQIGSVTRIYKSEKNSGVSQLVVAKQAGDYTVIASTDLQRIDEAGRVMKNQLTLVGTILLLVSVVGAIVFSRWFTKPITQLSNAAREIARGNYNVKVVTQGNDEISELCEDFNIMTKEVARTSQLQRELIANISHDLRTPLTLIKGYAETVRDLTGDNAVKRSEQLSVIIDETDRLSGLVNSVMELSRYSSGTEMPHKVKFNLSQLCEEAAYRYTDICEKNGYNLVVETEDNCVINADAEQLLRVIHNLLSNALHHVGADGFIAVKTSLKNGVVRLEIIDHGDGINENDLPYIFDRYYRTRASAGKVGTGLGLSITKAILQNHGFAYGVESVANAGTKFWFETNAIN